MNNLRVILFADFNSAFARDWANALREKDIDYLCVSSNKLKNEIEFDCIQPSNIISSLKHAIISKNTSKDETAMSEKSNSISLAREIFAFINALSAARNLRKETKRFEPELVHAMRSTFEGVAAKIFLPANEKLAVSIWGNDFTLHCKASRITTKLVKSTLKRVRGIHADAEIDLHRASNSFELNRKASKLHVPTSGGVPTNQLRLDISKKQAKEMLGIGAEKTLIVNPRGLRSYINSNVFFEAGEADENKNNVYLAVNVNARPGWTHYANPSSRLLFSESLDRAMFFTVLRAADIVVSPSRYDGTPNSILESMGSGAFIIMTDIKSTNDLVNSDKQRAIFDVESSSSLLNAINNTLLKIDLIEASELNVKLVKKFHSRSVNVEKILKWYKSISQNLS